MSTAITDEVISVGGFVTTSPQLSAALKSHDLAPPDLSAVRIELFNPSGIKQSEGDCSPNGYYFVPVDSGTYTVRVKALPGWVFTPSVVRITCDKEQCNDGADVNFELTGVELSGRIEPGPSAASCRVSGASVQPLSGISVTVKAADSKATVAAVLVQDSNTFTTGPLLPGKYVVTATHPEWQLGPSRISHTLSLGSPQLTKPFQVSGYLLTGSVTSNSGPVAGIQVTLLSADLTAAGCTGSHPPAAVAGEPADGGATPVCSVTSSPTGQFTFPGVPCGTYVLQAQHPDPDSTFEIQPSSITAVVGQGNAKVPESFKVTGFSVQGRVVNAAGSGVAGVVISVAGSELATTDSLGRYVLARMQEGRVDISAAKQHYAFSSLTAVQVTPAAQVVPDIIVKAVAVCGKLIFSADSKFKIAGRRVSLTSTDEAGITELVSSDPAGNFCFSVPAGSYRIAPYASVDEKSKGLIFNPSHLDAGVVGEPRLDITFSQAQLTVSGTVVCLDEACPGDTQLTLRSGAGKVSYTALLSEVAVKDQGAVPGRYSLVASRAGWCWTHPEGVEVVVEATDVEAPALSQAGYLLQFSISHASDLTINTPSSDLPVATLQAVPGKGSLCLPGSGTYSVTPVSCYLFPAESFAVVVKPSFPPEPLSLRANKVYVSGQVVIEAGASTAAEALPSDVTITATLAGSGAPDAAAAVITKATPDNADTPRVFTYALAVDLGATMVISPSVAEGLNLLFYPKSQIFKHDATAKGCPPAVQAIKAKPGTILAGITEPPVEDAVVKVFFKGSSAAAGRSAGDLAAEGVTDADGSFSLGPLYDDVSGGYSIELLKPGYVFSSDGEADGQMSFGSKQLAQVKVTVDLPEGAEPSAVFLSLSGGKGFKNNARQVPALTHTLGADRLLTFLDLQPGTYYLKPLLREHQFDPPVADIKLEDGEAKELTLRAVRTSWGISGTVTSVGGSPLAGAVVEACQGSGSAAVVLDSSVADDSGAYRIGNLKPGYTYEMRVKLDGRVISAHPISRTVDLGQQDERGVNFIAFRTSSRSELTGLLNLPAQLRSAVKAELLPAGAASKAAGPAAASVAVDASGFFELRGLKPGQYVLRISCDTAATGGLACEVWDMPVQVGNKDLHLGLLPFQPSAAATDVHQRDIKRFKFGPEHQSPEQDVCQLSIIPAHLVILCASDYFQVQNRRPQHRGLAGAVQHAYLATVPVAIAACDSQGSTFLSQVWQQRCMAKVLLTLPLPAMQLLLSSDQLKADSEDTVLYTAQRYMLAQPEQQQGSVTKGLAPLIRCPLLSGLQLSAHAGSSCIIKRQSDVDLETHCPSVLTPLLPQVRKLGQLRRLKLRHTQLLEAVENNMANTPASWLLDSRQSSSSGQQPEVSVTWKLPVEELKAACRECASNEMQFDLHSPGVTPPMAGMAWQLLVECKWVDGQGDDVSGGVQVGLYATAAYYPRGEVDAYYSYKYHIKQRGWAPITLTATATTLSCGYGYADGWGVGVMTGEDGWDESAWVSKGLPAEGELELQLVVEWVR
eukprot:gene12385-12519_t